jgi:hypothetical protein
LEIYDSKVVVKCGLKLREHKVCKADSMSGEPIIDVINGQHNKAMAEQSYDQPSFHVWGPVK